MRGTCRSTASLRPTGLSCSAADVDAGRVRLVGNDLAEHPRPVHRHCDRLPPGSIGADSRGEVKHDAFRGDRAGDRLAQARPRDADAIVEVDFTPAIVTRIHLEPKRPGRLIRSALYQGLLRYDRSWPDEHRQTLKLRPFADLLSGEPLARPVIVPAFPRQADVIGIRR